MHSNIHSMFKSSTKQSNVNHRGRVKHIENVIERQKIEKKMNARNINREERDKKGGEKSEEKRRE